MPLTLLFPRRIFVCPSNCGFAILTETTAVIPSLTSSPRSEMEELSLIRPFLFAIVLMARVIALLNPSRCVPPSRVLTEFTYEKIFSSYPVVYWMATSISSLFSSSFFEIKIGTGLRHSAPSFRYLTNSDRPPRYWYLA